MSTSHPIEHDERVRRLLLGGPEQDAELDAQIAECETCRALARELAGVVERLEEVGAAERRVVLAAAERIGSAPGEERAAETLRRAMAAGESPGRPSRTVLLVVAALAAAIVVVIVAARAFQGPGDEIPDNVFVGQGDFSLVSPLGRVTSMAPFVWESTVEAGGWFEVLVHDAAALEGPAIIETETEEPRWTPTREELQLLPARIRWEVRAYDSSGAPVGSAAGEAWR